MEKTRLDQRVFDLGLAESREKAKALIMAGSVYADGQKLTKPGTAVSAEARIEVRGQRLPYVSRGGLKLEKAVKKVFDLRPTAIIRDLDLRRPIYRRLAAYGHMGREDLGVRWEDTDRAEVMKAVVAEL